MFEDHVPIPSRPPAIFYTTLLEYDLPDFMQWSIESASPPDDWRERAILHGLHALHDRGHAWDDIAHSLAAGNIYTSEMPGCLFVCYHPDGMLDKVGDYFHPDDHEVLYKTPGPDMPLMPPLRNPFL